ncbi:hypothetical protein CERSUDRAFT_112260 [Gelatoporia subvermispora B]|uniref:Zinc/iron permease n=1 Tax=Ceriporiopsis subvermispora (strain B) TaxID=914234 RepID=M2RNL8_CERS8|nr:hypothetical protein CERSUDRAFT_112260 [Gelatoporia subvermispora B]
MPGFLSIIVMSALLGGASFGIGVLPLSFAFSKYTLAKLSALGTGLLLGAALGVIIPEGIETLVESNVSTEFPASIVAFSLLMGFTFMLLLEQLHSPHSHSHPSPSPIFPNGHESGATRSTVAFTDTEVEFDVELGDLERSEGIPPATDHVAAKAPTTSDSGSKKRAYPLTLGLVIHALADGLALGSSALSRPSTEPGATESLLPSELSIVVFLALLIHKAPTTLALSTSLLSTSLTKVECRRHIAIFAASTPAGALISYLLLSFLGASSEGRWPGIALLISGGTFLYVATVLQPVSSHGSEEIGQKARLAYLVFGMFLPLAIGAVIGHEH